MPAGSGIRSIDTLFIVGSASSTGSTITVPSTARAGDLLVLFDCPAFNSTTGISGPVPSGFTGITAFPASGWDNGFIVSSAVATAASAGSVLTGASGNRSNAKILVVIRANATIKTFTAFNIKGQVTDTNPSGIDISGSGVTSPAVLLCAGTTFTNSSIDWEGYPSLYTTPAFDSVIRPIIRIVTGISLITQSEASYNQRIDMVDYGSGNMLFGCWLKLT